MEKYVALIGLGVVGAPLANNLYKKYADDFALLSSEDFVSTLIDNDIYMNGEQFNPKVYTNRSQLKKKIGIVFICVKNYHIKNTAEFLHTIIDDDTVIMPLQNGVYSYDFFCKEFPNNVVLEGFAQGPNTQIFGGCSFVYQKPGLFHIGTSVDAQKDAANYVYNIMKNAGINVFCDDDIKYQVWKKLMLNVAGNAVTALTGIDYCMFINSTDAQNLCINAMREFIEVAGHKGIELKESDIQEILQYYFSFKVSKKTSMLEDVINKRPTENKFLAGYICGLAKEYNLNVPCIETLNLLINIKENVYLNKYK